MVKPEVPWPAQGDKSVRVYCLGVRGRPFLVWLLDSVGRVTPTASLTPLVTADISGTGADWSL